MSLMAAIRRSWCPVCAVHTEDDLDRCSLCGARRDLPTGEQCACGSVGSGGNWTRVLNSKCVVHGKARPKLKLVPLDEADPMVKPKRKRP